ncbi:unnamed protein product [Amoebophrya sp. A120]|nr:unnamed protein product [Amoebophrya sp. A120]|eukprot:GSA120T00021539001.1
MSWDELPPPIPLVSPTVENESWDEIQPPTLPGGPGGDCSWGEPNRIEGAPEDSWGMVVGNGSSAWGSSTLPREENWATSTAENNDGAYSTWGDDLEPPAAPVATGEDDGWDVGVDLQLAVETTTAGSRRSTCWGAGDWDHQAGGAENHHVGINEDWGGRAPGQEDTEVLLQESTHTKRPEEHQNDWGRSCTTATPVFQQPVGVDVGTCDNNSNPSVQHDSQVVRRPERREELACGRDEKDEDDHLSPPEDVGENDKATLFLQQQDDDEPPRPFTATTLHPQDHHPEEPSGLIFPCAKVLVEMQPSTTAVLVADQQKECDTSNVVTLKNIRDKFEGVSLPAKAETTSLNVAQVGVVDGSTKSQKDVDSDVEMAPADEQHGQTYRLQNGSRTPGEAMPKREIKAVPLADDDVPMGQEVGSTSSPGVPSGAAVAPFLERGRAGSTKDVAMPQADQDGEDVLGMEVNKVGAVDGFLEEQQAPAGDEKPQLFEQEEKPQTRVAESPATEQKDQATSQKIASATSSIGAVAAAVKIETTIKEPPTPGAGRDEQQPAEVSGAAPALPGPELPPRVEDPHTDNIKHSMKFDPFAIQAEQDNVEGVGGEDNEMQDEQDEDSPQHQMLELNFGKTNRRALFTASIELNDKMQKDFNLIEGKHYKLNVLSGSLLLGFRTKEMREFVREQAEGSEILEKVGSLTVEEVIAEDFENEEAVEKMEIEIDRLVEKEDVPEWNPP